ncbi:MAG TPA: ankyrin repeat domain-containing protein, partial [Methylomirabilota bacterium]|nr:ankyrin repeat domain-containing protein [Methylomirabilota bacterium]
AVAREHGFRSWRALRSHLDSGRLAERAVRVEELFAAIRRGEEAGVTRVLDADPTLADARDAEGSTPLLTAVDFHRPAIVQLLLGRGADPGGVYAHSAHTPLSWVVTAESFEAAEVLVRAGVEPDLYCAAGLGDVERIHAFFGPDGRLRPGASKTGSSRYAPDGSRLPCPPPTPPEIVADALYIACRCGREAAVRELLTHEPDLSFRAFAGATALHWAHFAGAPAVAALLVQHGADPTLRDPVLGCTPDAFGINFAASTGWLGKVRGQVARDPGLVHATSARGGPLHEAAWAGALEALKVLVDTGADPAKRNAEGKTALDLARERPDRAGCVAVAEWLKGSALEPRRS